MTANQSPSGTAGHSAPMRRISAAAFAGTTIEFYDLFIFGTATALVFGSVFFEAFGGGRGTLALGATYAVAFIARPIGSVLFGHIGDRVGRKKTLIYTMSLMGLSTFAVGLIPSYAAIGIAAPIILVTLRFLQGLAVGGEWAGAALLIAEHAPPKKRGLYGMFPQLGAGLAFGFSAATFLLIFELTGDPTSSSGFQTWGWRVPFLASIVLVGLGLYVRLKIEETPVFASASDRALAKVPLRDAVTMQWRQILLTGGAVASIFGFFYVGLVFVTGYAGKNPKGVPPGILGLSTPTILKAQIAGAIVFAVLCALGALCSDRVGRRRVMLIGNAIGIPIALVAFPIMDSGGGLAFGLASCLLFAMVGTAFGPAASYLPEMFDTRYRYTGAGLGYNLAGVLGGAIPIVLAPEILDTWGSDAIGYYLAGLAVLSAACLLALPETKDVDIEAPPVPRRVADLAGVG